MNTLTIESSTDIELLALTKGKEHFQFAQKTGLSHSTDMFINLEWLLDSARINVGQIDLIGAGTGPGSFTGVRIAVSTARMLSQILGVPLVGVKSHEIYAASCETVNNGLIAVAFDAKKSRVYAALYSRENGSTSPLIEPGDFTMTEFLEKIPSVGMVTCIGDGFTRYSAELRDYGTANGTVYSFTADFMPSGKAASLLVQEKFRESPQSYTDYLKILPRYERLSDAENAYNCRNR